MNLIMINCYPETKSKCSCFDVSITDSSSRSIDEKERRNTSVELLSKSIGNVIIRDAGKPKTASLLGPNRGKEELGEGPLKAQTGELYRRRRRRSGSMGDPLFLAQAQIAHTPTNLWKQLQVSGRLPQKTSRMKRKTLHWILYFTDLAVNVLSRRTSNF